MTEWKMHTMENDRKITHWKMTENTHLENAQPGKCTPWKMTEWKMDTLENVTMENAHPEKWQKIHNLENNKKYTTGICQTFFKCK